jgi:signal transduction histidine kinase/CheY-like chemotaxis protein
MLKILLVEDNPGDVLIVKDLLKSAGLAFELTLSSTLKESLMLCVEHDFDIILVDLGLPDSIGLETLRRIHPFTEKSPLVVMTGLDDEEVALEALRGGAQDYLVKNRLTSDTILRSIRYSIERKKIQDLHKQYTKRFTILSAATAALNESEDIPLFLKIICANLRLLLQKARAMAFDFSEPGYMRVTGIDWLIPWFDQIRKLSGWELSNSVFPLEKKRKESLSGLYDAKLQKMKSFREVFKDILAPTICRKFEDIFSINHVYAIGFCQEGFFYGGLLIISELPISEDDISIIEAISNQTSLNIHKRTIERDLRISENRYRSLSQELEEKVKERTLDLELLNDQLKDLNATKDKFFNIVAHDLKNPFTSLLGSSELLFQNIDKLDVDNIRKLALILNDSAKSGYAILQNLLDWSRSQTGMLKYSPEKINLKQLIDENIMNLELFSTTKEVKIVSELKKDLPVIADKNIVNTILRNLLSNAIKFSYRHGKIIIRTNENTEEVVISVRDFGTGIPKDSIEKIFRIDARYSLPGTENEQGTGLGLKLCKEFAEKQGGRIWVESEVNKGSEFFLSLSPKN